MLRSDLWDYIGAYIVVKVTKALLVAAANKMIKLRKMFKNLDPAFQKLTEHSQATQKILIQSCLCIISQNVVKIIF